ncbi:MAG: Phosphatidylinositol alpha-mannosyltransferase [uncultured Nocardioidaceae bacterium]|uniref:Phosphatidylinositol alpha-mannosyltransferase n=1 Tax=uncultured Nocardioidaceae bacterium TaxID=253824 RepID=A0A6J4L9D8_9ACTN|nr:MAG: Phosphatidylinositol alpha-mannosyltransferase [uncultured Nocardioidaceae bacterium]
MSAGVRIGLVCPYSLDVPGGVQNHVLGLASTLSRRGHHVAVLAPGGRGGRGAPPLPAYVTTTGRAVPVRHNGSVARVAFGPVTAARVRRWLDVGRFDLVHLHEPATPSPSVLALWAARPPVVATFHTAQERGWALGTSAATVLRPGLRKIAAHVAVSEAAGHTLERYLRVDPVVVPNGIDRGAFSSPGRTPPVGARVGGNSGGADRPGPALLFLGRIDEPRKGLGVLLEALPTVLEQHPGVRLTVVGPGTAPTLCGAVADRVRFTGPVDEREKAALLAGADVLVAPNTGGESFGIVLAEAMAAGTAVAASDLAAFRAVLQQGRCGLLFPPGDADALATVVDRLLREPGLRRDVVRRGRTASAAYDWGRVTDRLEQVYADVLRVRPGTGPRRRMGP